MDEDRILPDGEEAITEIMHNLDDPLRCVSSDVKNEVSDSYQAPDKPEIPGDRRSSDAGGAIFDVVNDVVREQESGSTSV